MQTYFFLILYFALIFQEFKYAEFTYHYCLETGFKRNEELIIKARSSVMNFWKENCNKWYMYIKKSCIGLVHMLTRFMPEGVQRFTEPFFANIMASYDTALQQSKMMESTTDFSDTNAMSSSTRPDEKKCD